MCQGGLVVRMSKEVCWGEHCCALSAPMRRQQFIAQVQLLANVVAEVLRRERWVRGKRPLAYVSSANNGGEGISSAAFAALFACMSA